MYNGAFTSLGGTHGGARPAYRPAGSIQKVVFVACIFPHLRTSLDPPRMLKAARWAHGLLRMRQSCSKNGRITCCTKGTKQPFEVFWWPGGM
ncbi:hypothetical protein FOMPIDRAFT_1022953 [Fomitopsis schrenkii]|uniref:Uncharacterized protein n=1 Tax=Fomitopsis schrenkii TaxID=2126942 RepID=S8EBR8_FOMSC|nr:hypothetical protein FOMPIDRAFT_1022953 [Fomitopsis schrenkii]